MGKCSTCGGTRVNNILQHRTTCEFYRELRPRPAPLPDPFASPDLQMLDAELDRWYSDRAE